MIILGENMFKCGIRLKKLRIARGLSLDELQNYINVSSTVLGIIEEGREGMLSTYILVKLAKFYGVTTDYILGVQ